jgi:hypothetical protein
LKAGWKQHERPIRPFFKNPNREKRQAMFENIRVSSLATVFGAALLAATAVPQLGARDFNNKTVVSFGAPVEISGQVLPAGTYVLRTLGNGGLVTVTNLDENRSYGTFPTVSVETSTVSDQARVEIDRNGSAPDAVHAWFYPGDTFGREFPAPKVEK